MKKTFLTIALISAGLFFVWTGFLWRIFGCSFAGSYPCVETWDLKVKEKDLIQIIQDIKREYPELRPPDTNWKDGRTKNWDSTDLQALEMYNKDLSPQYSYWYHIEFYYQDTKEIVHTWTRPDYDSSLTTFAFVGISSYKIKSNPTTDSLRIKLLPENSQAVDDNIDFKAINRDFGYFANKRQVWKFETNILNLIRQKISKEINATQDNGLRSIRASLASEATDHAEQPSPAPR